MDTYSICILIELTLMASLLMFPSFFKLKEDATDFFTQ